MSTLHNGNASNESRMKPSQKVSVINSKISAGERLGPTIVGVGSGHRLAV